MYIQSKINNNFFLVKCCKVKILLGFMLSHQLKVVFVSIKLSIAIYKLNINLIVLLVWFGVVFVRDGMYKDGIFRFNISIPENFPDNNKPPVRIYLIIK